MTFLRLNMVMALLALVLLILHFAFQFSLLYLLIPALIWIIAVIYGSSSIQSGMFIPAVCTLSSRQSIALTFDDGPHPQTVKILDLLDRFQAKATFFIIGQNAEKYPELVSEIIKRGHSIGNHSFQHGFWFSLKNKNQMIDEMNITEKLLLEKFSYSCKLFRPPYGVTNPAVAGAIKVRKDKVVGWRLRSLDTLIQDEDKLKKRILRRIKGGDIILLHDHAPPVIPALEAILNWAEQNQISCVKID